MHSTFYLLLLLLSSSLYPYFGFCVNCNSCKISTQKKEPTFPQNQYFLLADSSFLSCNNGSPSSTAPETRPEVIAISEAKSDSTPCAPSQARPTAKRCIQSFDPYTTIVKTLYGAHTEMTTSTQCAPATLSQSNFMQQQCATNQQALPFMLPVQQLGQLVQQQSIQGQVQQQQITQPQLQSFAYPVIASSCAILPTSKVSDLLSNNQLLALIHEQMCVQNDRLGQLFKEVVSKNLNAPTSVITKTVSNIKYPAESYLNCWPNQTQQPQPSIMNLPCPSILSNALPISRPSQMRVIVATSTYLLPANPSLPDSNAETLI